MGAVEKGHGAPYGGCREGHVPIRPAGFSRQPRVMQALLCSARETFPVSDGEAKRSRGLQFDRWDLKSVSSAEVHRRGMTQQVLKHDATKRPEEHLYGA